MSTTEFEYVVFPNGEPNPPADPNGPPHPEHPALLGPVDAPVKPKRIHVLAACQFCKARKMRCDGQRPTCGSCLSRNQACAFPDFVKTRGPNKTRQDGGDGDVKRGSLGVPQGFRRVLPPPNEEHELKHEEDAGAPSVPPHELPDPSMLEPVVPPPKRRKRSAAVEAVPHDGMQDAAPDHDGGTLDADGTYQDTGAGGSRKRASMACHWCRTRKMKCDEVHPACTSCVRRDLDCTYDTFVRRRGPSKKKKLEDAGGSLADQPAAAAMAAAQAAAVAHMAVLAESGVPKYILMDPQQHLQMQMHTAPPHLEDTNSQQMDHAPPVIWS